MPVSCSVYIRISACALSMHGRCVDATFNRVSLNLTNALQLFKRVYMTRFPPDPKQKRPSAEEIMKMWDQLEVVNSPLVSERFNHVLSELGASYAGGAKCIRLEIASHPVMDWFGSRRRLQESCLGFDFIPNFLTHPVVLKTLEEADILNPKISENQLVEMSAFTLDGALAQILRYGGAYPSHAFKGTDREAKELGNTFCSELFDSRYSEIALFNSHVAWSSWFMDELDVYNRSWFGFDSRFFNFWILALTDTD